MPRTAWACLAFQYVARKRCHSPVHPCSTSPIFRSCAGSTWSEVGGFFTGPLIAGHGENALARRFGFAVLARF